MKINLKELAKFNKIAIAIHTRPDGDAIGSSLGLYYGFKKLGKEVDLLCDMPVPYKLNILWGVDKYNQTARGEYDLVVFCDCGDITRTGNLGLDIRRSKICIIDHHETSIPNGDYNCILPYYASCSEIVLEILLENDIEINEDIANCLYCGLMTDTGNFSHTNTTESSFIHAAKLCKLGANPNLLSRQIFKLLEGNKVKLIGYALDNLKFECNRKIAYYYLSSDTLEKLNCDLSQTEGIIDNALSVEGVQIAIAITDGAKQEEHKISFRSIDGVDVSRLASTFGGGGHKQAAGCSIFGSIYDVEEKVLGIAKKYIIE